MMWNPYASDDSVDSELSSNLQSSLNCIVKMCVRKIAVAARRAKEGMNGNGDMCIGRYAGMWEAVQLDMCLIGIRLFDMDTGTGTIFSLHLWYFG